jgi:hypothetical protein
MATLEDLYRLFRPSVTTKLDKDVVEALGPPTRPETPLTDLSKVSKRPPSSAGIQTGSPAIVKMPRSGEVRRGKTLDQGPPTSPQGAAYGLKPGTPLTIEQMEQLRAGAAPAAMGEFAGATMPNLLRPDFREIDVATRPINPVRAPGEGFNQFEQMEELDANNLALANLIIQDSPYTAPKAALGAGLMDGADQAEYNNQKREQKGLLDSLSEGMGGLLGNDTVQAFLQVLARPEFVAPMGPGQSPVTNFINAAAADRTARAAQKKAAGEAALEMFKADTDRREALQIDPSKLPKLNSQAVDLTTGIQANKTLINLGNQIKTILTKDIATTGAPGAVGQALESIGAAFGFSPEEGAGSSKKEINDYVARMRLHILGTGVFGREANKQELALLNSILPESGFWTSREQIRRNIDAAMKSSEELMAIKNNLLIQSGYKGFDEMTKQSWRRGV